MPPEDVQSRGIEPYNTYRQQVRPCHPTTDFIMLTWRSYAKQRLTMLHSNIMVQRSPSHFQTGTFYWAHVCCSILLEIRSAYEARSMRRCALLTRQLRSWGASTSALGGVLLLAHYLVVADYVQMGYPTTRPRR